MRGRLERKARSARGRAERLQRVQRAPYIPALEKAYEDVNASFGDFSLAGIKASTKALSSNAPLDADYTTIENQITMLTGQRDTLAGAIKQR